MGLPIADRWFDRTRIDDEITLLWEPYVDPLLRCNIYATKPPVASDFLHCSISATADSRPLATPSETPPAHPAAKS